MPSKGYRKHLPTTDAVCRAWASQTQPEGQAATVHFRAESLFSYGTCIARLVVAPAGVTVALISSAQWSSGTSKVQGEAGRAASDAHLACFTVPDLRPDHDSNLLKYEANIRGALEAVERARTPESHRSRARTLIAIAKGYAERFGVAWRWTGAEPASVLSRAEREAA